MSWIGVDLDRTLAHYDGWRGEDHIGPPVEIMVNRVREWLACGLEVRIFTARASSGPDAINVIQDWCEKHIGVRLPVTNVKDYECVQIWDDIAIRVAPNTGRIL